VTWITVIIGAVLGACIGSFLTCVTWRVPQRKPITGRSVCPVCGRQLKARWNVPVLGWAALRGRSGCCDQPISVRYPLIELAGAAAGAAAAYAFGIIAVYGIAVGVILVSALISQVTARSEK
jgi:leader peptidase (prepilin peptidase)/N-methyltransferase